MHHVALDRSGAHDRDLDDEIVKFFRPEPRQHRHLGAALDLEHADRVGTRQHFVDLGLLRRNGGEREGGSTFFSLPPCGGGSGWGVVRVWHWCAASPDPYPRPLPTRGRG